MKHIGHAITKGHRQIGDIDNGIGGGHSESDRSAGGAAPRAWLRSKGNSIEGGTSEIQLNIVAKRILELPGS